MDIDTFPRMINYSDKEWKNGENCIQNSLHHPELLSDNWLGCIKACEILLIVKMLR